jgi:hypothetical protein
MNFAELLNLQLSCPLCSKPLERFFLWAADKGYDSRYKELPHDSPWRAEVACGDHFSVLSVQKWFIPNVEGKVDDARLEIDTATFKLPRYQIKLLANKNKKVIISLGSKDRLMANALLKLNLTTIEEWLKDEIFLTNKIEKLLILK